MRINVCVNGTFRYPEYIRHYAEAGVLNQFFYAHARRTTAATLGLRPAQARNIWLKEYGLRAVFHWAPSPLAGALSQRICDAWQDAVLRHWTPCDSVEVVPGALADRVIKRARQEGACVLGHPVTAHPQTVQRLVGGVYASLGLPPLQAQPTQGERRRRELEGCDALIVDSSHVARSYREAGVPAGRIAIVRPALDLQRFRIRTRDETDAGTFRVLCVGILTPRKAQHVLIEAWRRLRFPKAELILIGARGRHAAAVLRGADATVRHVPHVPHNALRAWLVRASAFVLCSVEDGFGQAPLEAMACGVPTIVTDAVGMSDIVENGRNGLVIPPLDGDALAAALEGLYRDRRHGQAMGLAGAATVHAAGSWADYATSVIDQHRRLVDGREPVRGAA